MERFLLNGEDWEIKEFLGEDWIWRNAQNRDTRDVRWWKKAQVPGSITDDLWKLGEIPDPYFERNSLLIEWIPERTWIYRKLFIAPASMKGHKITLHFEGIDYSGLFYLNDVLLGRQEGMFTPAAFDVTGIIDWEGENQISVVLDKAPDEQPQVSKTEYVKTHKSRMTYWWDFCPRMIHVGIWDDVYLEAHDSIVIKDTFVRPILKEDLASAGLQIQLTVVSDKRQQGEVKLQVREGEQTVKELEFQIMLFPGENKIPAEIILENPKLWWPNGYGSQPLYSMEASILGKADEAKYDKSVNFGIRSLSFRPNEGAELNADSYTLHVNGRRIYIKGWNWVPIDVMYGVKRPQKLRHLLTLAKEANVNMLRIWGGGLIEREDFYELCDELGILLWQEFIQSSSGIDNKPSQDLSFLEMMGREAEKIIPRKRSHPSLALWCGGNELQSGEQSMIKDTEPVIRILRRAVAELDPDRKFLSSSPTGRIFNNDMKYIKEDPNGLHDVHGPWEHQGLVEQYTLYNSGTSLFSSEYGVEGMANYNTLARSMEECHMWPPSRDNIYYFHRGSWWNNYTLVQKSFGEGIEDIHGAIRASQFLQYEGLRYGVESNRRRAFHNSGSMMWQFNEPYPNNYCTSCVDYYGQPKPAYYGVKRAYGRYLVSASFPGQALEGFEDVKADIFFHSSHEASFKVRISCRITGSSGREYYHEEKAVESAGESLKVLTVKLPLSHIGEQCFFLLLDSYGENGESLSSNRYFFTKEGDLRCLLKKDTSALDVSLIPGGDSTCPENAVEHQRLIKIRNTGNQAAVGIKLEEEREAKSVRSGEFVRFSDNYFSLMPGEEAYVTMVTAGKEESGIRVRISGFGVEEVIFAASV